MTTSTLQTTRAVQNETCCDSFGSTCDSYDPTKHFCCNYRFDAFSCPIKQFCSNGNPGCVDLRNPRNPEYHLEVGSDICPAGTKPITNQSKCQLAARSLGFNGVLATSTIGRFSPSCDRSSECLPWPTGCFYLIHRNSRIVTPYFLTEEDLLGTINHKTGPICEKEFTATTSTTAMTTSTLSPGAGRRLLPIKDFVVQPNSFAVGGLVIV